MFLVDEIGQYIGDNSGMMLNLQTLVEELGSRCKGKVWVIVTSQEDIDAVTHVKGNDFSKIQGRFNTRLSLSSRLGGPRSSSGVFWRKTTRRRSCFG